MGKSLQEINTWKIKLWKGAQQQKKLRKKKITSSRNTYWIPILSKNDPSHDTLQVSDFFKVTEWPPEF